MGGMDNDTAKLVAEQTNKATSRATSNTVMVVIAILVICQSFLLTWLWCTGRVELSVNARPKIVAGFDGLLPIKQEVRHILSDVMCIDFDTMQLMVTMQFIFSHFKVYSIVVIVSTASTNIMKCGILFVPCLHLSLHIF